MTTSSKKPATKKAAPAKTVGKTLEDFRSAHDESFLVPQKIKEGLEKLGEDGWEYENNFIKICGLATHNFSRYREQFEDFYVNVGGRNAKRVWAGSKKLAAKMREMV